MVPERGAGGRVEAVFGAVELLGGFRPGRMVVRVPYGIMNSSRGDVSRFHDENTFPHRL